VLSRRAALALPLLAATPARAAVRRVVIAGGGLAEIATALGAGPDIVAVDSTALFPTRLRALPQVGYLRALGAEGVLSVAPDLLLLAHEAGPPEAVAQLMRSGVTVVRAPQITDAATLVSAVRIVAAALGRVAEGEALAAAITADFAALTTAIAALPRRPVAVFVLAVGGGAPQAAGEATAATAMLTLAGARNAVTGYRGYKPIAAEALLAAEPDAVVTTTHTLSAVGGIEALAANPALALLRATRARRIIALDSLYLLGFGPRTAHAARDLAAALHGEGGLPALPARPWLRDEP
jgi:iron complex transport system substrate-binding protein